MTLNFHLEGEKVFSSTKHNVDFSFGANNKSHRPNHVKFSRPHVAIPTCHPNNVNNLQVHGSPCVTQSMFSILSQGGIVVNEITCEDGLWHIDWCLFLLCSAMFYIAKKY
jgi:hypothetical protein